MFKKFISRVSVRDFKDHVLSNEEISKISDLINSTPTSTNSVQYSAVLLTEKSKLKAMAEITGQKYIASASGFVLFLADRTRMLQEESAKHSKEFLFHDYIRTIQDASIAGGIVSSGLLGLKFSSTFIGNTQSQGKKLEKEFELPSSAFPVLGLVFGRANSKNPVKPKLNRVFLNKYSKKQAINDYQTYDKDTINYFKSIDHPSFSDQMRLQMKPDKVWEKRFKDIGKYLMDKWKNFK